MNAHAAAQTRQDPRIGMVLQERYRILRKLGDGGMGSVYEAEHLLIKRRVAIKVLHSQFADNPGIVARFRREAEAATSIGHPNIIEVTDMGSFPDGTTYMVLEFLEGRDWAKDIATELVVTEAAVKQHLLRLYQKFRVPEGINRRTRLANEVIAMGLVRPLPTVTVPPQAQRTMPLPPEPRRPGIAARTPVTRRAS